MQGSVALAWRDGRFKDVIVDRLGLQRYFVTTLLVAAFAAPTLVCSSPSHACTCRRPPIVERIANAEFIFIGELIDEEPDYSPKLRPSPDRHVTFTVLASWKGAPESPITLGTRPGGSYHTCGWWGPIGQQYLIFASRDDHESNRLRVRNYCHGDPVFVSESDIAYLDDNYGRILGAGTDSTPDSVAAQDGRTTFFIIILAVLTMLVGAGLLRRRLQSTRTVA